MRVSGKTMVMAFRYGFVYARPQQFGALHIADALRVRARA